MGVTARRCRTATVAAAVTLVAGVGVAMLTGTVGVVTTSGRSMNPTYHDGDLVVVAATGAYAAGQVVAYRDDVHDLVVLHRIVGGSAAGFELKGDDNAAVDTIRPPRGDLMGRAVLHVPGAGAWLDRLAGPGPLAAVALVLVTAGATIRTRRRPRSPAMSRHAARAGAAPPLRSAAAVVTVVGVAGLALAALTWTTPVRTMVSREQRTTRSMTFSYAADVARTAAYDGTTVRSPDPVFRRLANAVDVRFAYDGPPGTLTVAAELSADNGWHATIPLAAARDVPDRYDGMVRLDLAALEGHAHAAAAVTGLPIERIAVSVTPRVVTGTDGIAFAPALRLTLTSLQLVLAGGPATLTVADTTTVQTTEPAARRVSLLSRSLSVATGRAVAAGLLLAALVAALALVLVARRAAPATEGALIRRRYAARLLAVCPSPVAPGHAVVDVVTFADLARLADRFGLLVLHWSRTDVDTFVVRHQDTTYRYRAGAEAAAIEPAQIVRQGSPMEVRGRPA